MKILYQLRDSIVMGVSDPEFPFVELTFGEGDLFRALSPEESEETKLNPEKYYPVNLDGSLKKGQGSFGEKTLRSLMKKNLLNIVIRDMTIEEFDKIVMSDTIIRKANGEQI